jgi:hypothetical protein
MSVTIFGTSLTTNTKEICINEKQKQDKQS